VVDSKQLFSRKACGQREIRAIPWPPETELTIQSLYVIRLPFESPGSIRNQTDRSEARSMVPTTVGEWLGDGVLGVVLGDGVLGVVLGSGLGDTVGQV
jgi:hypothetical protein